ncbi:hypothetical protein D3C71_1662970 [compost metagenome]
MPASTHKAGDAARPGAQRPQTPTAAATTAMLTIAPPTVAPSPAAGTDGASCASCARRTVPPAPRNAWALYSECASRCSSAMSQAPRPHCISMKPICAQVDQASITFTLMRVVITSAASTAVAAPTTTSNPCAPGTSDTSGAKRSSTNPPRLTTPACSRADTGVGASITWISQP